MSSRRDFLKQSLFSAGMFGLRSLATGIPVSVLLDPRIARSEEHCVAIEKAQFLVVANSGAGDPFNCNCPGMYEAANAGVVVHPANSVYDTTPGYHPTYDFRRVDVKLGAKTYGAAYPWGAATATDPTTSNEVALPKRLPQWVLDRTAFIHHTTNTANHADLGKILKLNGSTNRQEMAVSLIGKNTSVCLGTTQPQAVVFGGAAIQYDGQYQPYLTPLGLKSILSKPVDLPLALQTLRDKELDRMNAIFKESRATTRERAFLDRLVLSRKQIRDLSERISTDVANIADNSLESQAFAAALMIKLNVAPVVTLSIPFGSDNHADAGFVQEVRETSWGVHTIGVLMASLKTLGLEDKTTFAYVNVFGRQPGANNGRGHSPSHCVTMLVGKPIKPGVYGGLVPGGVAASSFDSATGAINSSGDVTATTGLASIGKTLAAAAGVSPAVYDDKITAGTVIKAALA